MAQSILVAQRAGWRWRVSLLLMAASGFAGLGYQIVWTQQGALWLGHEAAGVLAVVTAFFGGLAAGALLLGTRIERSARPVRWYAACELIIAAWSLVLAVAMPQVSTWLLDVTGVQPTPLWQWSVAFFGTFFLLLPATAAMGATLPAMERVTVRLHSEVRSIAPLYASNTFGAVLGVLAIAFWLAPQLGLVHTSMLCAALNVLCGVASLWLFAPTAESLSTSQLYSRANRKTTDIPDDRHSRVSGNPGEIAADWIPAYAGMTEIFVKPSVNFSMAATKNFTGVVLMRLAFTGLLGIGYEVLVVRVLSQVMEDTVYTFALLLAVYLVGSAAGAAIYARWLGRSNDQHGHQQGARSIDDRLLCMLALACVMGTMSLWFAEPMKAWLLSHLPMNMSTAIAIEAALAMIAFALPTLVMGALFSHLNARANAMGIGFGRAVGMNTLGATAAPLLFGVLAFPLLGPKLALSLICAGYLALTTWHAWRSPLWLMSTTVVLAMAIWAPRLAFIDVPEGGHVVSYREGVMAAVSVVEDADGVARLRIDNRQQEGSSATRRVDGRQAVLPLLLHAAPTQALFLGLGTGVTAATAANFPGIHVDAVELLPEVIAASSYFIGASSGNAAAQPLHAINADARRYVRTSGQRYDVIVADNFHPARSGSGSLYTVEHFHAVRARLTEQGIFCQWLPLHQLDLQTLRSILQSFIAVYPQGWALLASNSLQTPVLGLVGRADNQRFDANALRNALAAASRVQLERYGVEDEFALLGSFIAGPAALQRFAGDAPANTDDLPIVAYRAPRITYAADSLPRDRLLALLPQLSIHPEELLQPGVDGAWQQRLAAYWQARDRFIAIGREVRPMTDVRGMLAQVREPLLSILRVSPDFRPAYDPLLRMAMTLARIDIDAARVLLTDLATLQPMREEATLALREMSPALRP